MKKYHITSDRFKGYVELIYNEGILAHVNFTNAEMQMETAKMFIRSISWHQENVADNFGGSTKIVESDVEITFDMFWKSYQKKINKARAVKLWDKMNVSDRAAAYVGIRPYNKYLFENKWRSKADPETYLRNRYWENEYE